MKVSDSQKEIIKTLVYDIISTDPVNYHGINIDPDLVIDKSLNGALDYYSKIMDNDNLTVTELHSINVAVVTKLIMENMILNMKILSITDKKA